MSKIDFKTSDLNYILTQLEIQPKLLFNITKLTINDCKIRDLILIIN